MKRKKEKIFFFSSKKDWERSWLVVLRKGPHHTTQQQTQTRPTASGFNNRIMGVVSFLLLHEFKSTQLWNFTTWVKKGLSFPREILFYCNVMGAVKSPSFSHHRCAEKSRPHDGPLYFANHLIPSHEPWLIANCPLSVDLHCCLHLLTSLRSL